MKSCPSHSLSGRLWGSHHIHKPKKPHVSQPGNQSTCKLWQQSNNRTKNHSAPEGCGRDPCHRLSLIYMPLLGAGRRASVNLGTHVHGLLSQNRLSACSSRAGARSRKSCPSGTKALLEQWLFPARRHVAPPRVMTSAAQVLHEGLAGLCGQEATQSN